MRRTTGHAVSRFATRIDPSALEVIERLAAQRPTTRGQVTRTIIEDVTRVISENAA
ncbi:MAG: hypothetical protein WCE72_03455 [Pseudolabrys sp.]